MHSKDHCMIYELRLSLKQKRANSEGGAVDE